MLVFRCPVCGGELEIDEKMHIGKCQYCDSTVAIPQNFEKIGNLFNRANFLRQSNQFDKAMGVYEEILKEDNANSAAHFGMVLCNYGIEYVQDPKTQEMIPVCHRTKESSILQDPEYLKALECADTVTKEIYIQDTERIDKILKKIINASRNQEQFDVFISYKEENEVGERTEETLIAQDIWRELNKLGYKCFFARKTLENKLGEEFEPIIFSALNSSRVMLIVGCSVANFQSVWVKNEWSRFLELKMHDSEKIIIPCYKNISPYELPDELSRFQSENIAKIGFLQELCDGIERVLKRKTSLNSISKDSDKDSKREIEKQLKNASTFLKLNDDRKALAIYNSLANNNPEDYRVWWELARYYSEDFTNAYKCSQSVFGKVQEYVKNAMTVVNDTSKKEEFNKQETYYTNIYNLFHKMDGDKELIPIRELEKLENKLFELGMEDLNKKCFTEAYSKFERCVAVIKDARAYWGMILAKNQCENDEALFTPSMLYKFQEESVGKLISNKSDEMIRSRIDDFLGIEWKKLLECKQEKEKEDYISKIERIKEIVLKRYHKEQNEYEQKLRELNRHKITKLAIVVISGISILLYIYFAKDACFTGYYRLLQPMIFIGLYNLIIFGFVINPFSAQENYLCYLTILIDIIFVIECYYIPDNIGVAIFMGVIAFISGMLGAFIGDKVFK